MTKMAGSADSSPTNRCQSASGDVVILPRGAMPSIVSPGWAALTHCSPGPSPCRTTSSVTLWRAVSRSLIV